ncbi:hypothetical protein MCOR28_010756, partial [Pyricularia oryzae]
MTGGLVLGVQTNLVICLLLSLTGQSDFIYLKVRAHQGIRPTQGAPWLPMDCCIAFEQTFRVFEIDRHSVAPALHPQYNGSYDHL